MLQIPYVKVLPYPFEVILEQYFDYEHIAHVHPHSLGEYAMVEQRGCVLVYDQRWPARWHGGRAVSRVVQTYRPPGDIWFEFTSGKHRGTKVHTELKPHPQGTQVVETYHLPHLPNWSWLRRLIRPLVVRVVEKVWEEDLRVGVCIGGWPGLPEKKFEMPAELRRPLPPGTYRLGPIDRFPLGSMKRIETGSGPVLIARTAADEVRALQPNCPHTGGPLELGEVGAGCVQCPWHAARFDLTTGQAVSGPTKIPLAVYPTSIVEGELVVTVE